MRFEFFAAGVSRFSISFLSILAVLVLLNKPIQGQHKFFYAATEDPGSGAFNTQIFSVNVDGTNHQLVASVPLDAPSDLVLDSYNGWIFLVENSDAGFIARLNLDGTDFQEMYPLEFAGQLQIAPPSGMLFFNDPDGLKKTDLQFSTIEALGHTGQVSEMVIDHLNSELLFIEMSQENDATACFSVDLQTLEVSPQFSSVSFSNFVIDSNTRNIIWLTASGDLYTRSLTGNQINLEHSGIRTDNIGLALDVNARNLYWISSQNLRQFITRLAISGNVVSQIFEFDTSFEITGFEFLNHPPAEKLIDPVSIGESSGDQQVPVTVHDMFFDPDGDTLTFEIVNASEGFDVYLDNEFIRVNPEQGFVGEYTFTLRAIDGQLWSDKQVEITVEPDQTAPVLVQPFTDFEFSEDSGNHELFNDLTAHFEDQAPLTFSVHILDQPAVEATIVNNTSCEITTLADQFGTNELVISASDGAFVASDTFVVEITPVNDPPVLAREIGTREIMEDSGENVVIEDLNAHFHDVDDSTLAFLVFSSDDIHCEIRGTTLYVTPEKDFQGRANIEITAIDQAGLEVASTFALQVEDLNEPPEIKRQISDFLILEDAGKQLLLNNVNAYFYDPDDSQLEIVAKEIEGAAFFIEKGRLLVETAPDYAGTLAACLIATDPDSASIENYFTIEVQNVNDPPQPIQQLYPLNNTLLGNAPPISFSWSNPVDIDSDSVDVSLRIYNDTFSHQIDNIAGTRFTLSENILEPNTAYRWILIADDGEFHIESAVEFGFVTPFSTGISDADIPKSVALRQNYPNPFGSGARSHLLGNPTTTIWFEIPEPFEVSLQIFDISGVLIKTLAQGKMNAGNHHVQWDAANEKGQKVSSGIYLYKLTAGNQQFFKRMVFVR